AGWQTQLEVSCRRGPDLRADPAKLVRDVIKIVLDESPFHPKNVLQQMMQLHDERAPTHPYFLHEHPGVTLSRQQKASLLGQMIARLAVPGTEELPGLLVPVQAPQAERNVKQAA